ncbi:MAG: SDR family oxidoreductase [Gammaproteobacteria bacterium]
MPNVLITGCSRGLGLEWSRQLAEDGWRVYATCRYPHEAHELAALAGRLPGLSVHRLDVTDAADIRALRWELEDEPLDLLLNNAALYLDKDAAMLGSVRYDEWLRTFEVNTLGAVRLCEAFLPNLRRGERPLAVAVSSHMGSIADIATADSLYYRSSKAALNAAMRGLAAVLGEEGVGVLIVHPGWVRTRMGGPMGRLTTAQSVQGMRALVDNFGPAQHGRFFRYDGTELPW